MRIILTTRETDKKTINFINCVRYFYSFADTHFSSLRSLSRSFIYKLNVQCIVQIYLLFIHSRVLQSSSIYIYVAAVYVPDSWSTQESFSMTEREFSRDLRTFMCIICFAHYHRVYVLFESSSSRSDQSRRERKKLITMRTRSYIDPSTSTTHIINISRGETL